MMDIYHDCWIGQDGRPYWLRAKGSYVEINNLPNPVQLPWNVMCVRGWTDARGRHALTGKFVHDDAFVWAEGMGWKVLGTTWGVWACAFTPTGEVVVQHGANGQLHQYSLSGVLLDVFSIPAAAMGIHHIKRDGTVIMDEWSNPDYGLDRIIDGERWVQVDESGGVIIGAFGLPNYPASISIKRPNQPAQRWLGSTQLAARVVKTGDVEWVAISGRNAPAPDAIVWSATPAEPPVEPLPPPVEPPIEPPPPQPEPIPEPEPPPPPRKLKWWEKLLRFLKENLR